MKAPLLALAMALVAASPASEQRIKVALINFEFQPSTIELVHGEAYVLRLTASGKHSFAAKAFFAAAEMSDADRALVKDGRVEMDDDKPVEIHFIAPKAGTYPIRCTHLLHANLGMTGKFVVS